MHGSSYRLTFNQGRSITNFNAKVKNQLLQIFSKKHTHNPRSDMFQNNIQENVENRLWDLENIKFIVANEYAGNGDYDAPEETKPPSYDYQPLTLEQIIRAFDPYMLCDINSMSLRIPLTLINSLRCALSTPFWNYQNCSPLLKNLKFTNSELLYQFKGRSIFHTFEFSLNDFLNSLHTDFILHQTFYDQKLNGENMRFFEAFSFDLPNPIISSSFVPVIIVGIICIKDKSSFAKPARSTATIQNETISNPAIASLGDSESESESETNTDVGSKLEFCSNHSISRFAYHSTVAHTLPIPPVPNELDTSLETDIFDNFNRVIHEIESESYYAIQEDPLYGLLDCWKGPKFNVKPASFTDSSCNRWQLVEMNYVFKSDDPILKQLPWILKEIDNFTSKPNYPRQRYGNLFQPSYIAPTFRSLYCDASQYYISPKLENYLSPKPWGVQKIVNFNAKDKRFQSLKHLVCVDFEYSDTCTICLSKYKQNDVILQLSCNHIFHSRCVEQWIYSSNANKCPVCRATIKLT